MAKTINSEMDIEKQLHNYPSLSGKTIAVTGATGGIGSHFCRCLAYLGADIVMLDRNIEKSVALKNKLTAEFPDAKIENIKLDLADRASMVAACDTLGDRAIDCLVVNSGVYNVPLSTGESGYNNIFEVNFVSPYRLVRSLLPNVKRANGKVIAVGSIAYRYAKLDERDVDYSRKKRASKIYGNSKRFLMFSLYELFKNESGATFAVAHPGVTPTPMTTHYHRGVNWIVKAGMKVIFPSPEKAAVNIVHALFGDCAYHEWIGPKRLNVWGKPATKKVHADALECERIFEIAERIYTDNI